MLSAPTYPLFCETSVTSWLRNDLTKEGTLFQVWSSHLSTKGYPLQITNTNMLFSFVLTSRKRGALPGLIILKGTSPLPRLKLYKYVVSFCPEEGALESDSKLMIIGKNQVLPQFYSKLAKKFTRIYLQHFASLLWGCLLDEEPKKLAKQKLTYLNPSLLIWQEISYLIETKWDVQCSSNVAGMVIFSQRR